MSAIVDGHVHLWDPARGDYEWLTPAMTGLYRRFEQRELHALLVPARIDGVVLVQAAATEAESDYLHSIAQQTPWVFGVVGWVDFDSDEVEAAVAKRAAQEKFVGVRPMLQDIADPDWILHSSRARALAAIEAHALVFDALIHPTHITRIVAIARRYPRLQIVVDHAAKPTIGNTLDSEWQEGLRALAACPNVVCKLSGLLTQLTLGAAPEKVLECARLVLQIFGHARVIWGSDWPVLTEAGTYQQWLALTRIALADLSDSERAAVMGGNATRVYGLKTAVAPAVILLHPDDNVLVCCRAVSEGERLRIDDGEEIEVRSDVELGHKLARRAISVGKKVIKYGTPIGSMTAAVAAGEWIHLHNMKSDYISAHTRTEQAGGL
jgi:L-fuconolactonase